MKVIILNGSPKAHGNTATALHEVERTLQQQGIETEWIHVGQLQIHGCIACNKCWKTGICAFNDIVNEISEKMRESRWAARRLTRLFRVAQRHTAVTARPPVLFQPAYRLVDEGGSFGEHRPPWWRHCDDGRTEQVFPENKHARRALAVLEHRPRHSPW